MALIHEDITSKIIDSAIEVHKELGPGLLESAYEICLFHALTKRGLKVERQVNLPIHFQNVKLDSGYRLDLVIEDKVIVETKSIDKLQPIHDAQLMTYLRLSGKRVGLLINFNVELLKQGIRRKVM